MELTFKFFIHFFILLPLVSFTLSLFIPKKKENALSILAYTSVGLQLLVSIFFTYQWASHGFHEINLKEFSVYQNGNYDFYLDFYFDKLIVIFES
jgi:NADH:ubiquinone oxidoreductase subunit 5 (subunit L)/multisubunit Na+/H+ antiporter MnhA subunit